MDNMNRMRLATVVLILAGALVAQAGPVELKNVSAGAQWLAHVDVDGARSSKVVQALFQECGKAWPDAGERLRGVCERVGLQQCQDLHGITAYGMRLEPHNGVVIINANWNEHALSDKVEKAPDHKSMEYGKHHIHTWTAHRGAKHVHLVAGTLYKPDLLVLAFSPDLLKSALDVLDGKAAGMTGKESPLAAKVRQGTMFLARAVGLDRAAAARQCPVLQLIERFNYEEGQHEGRWFGQLTVSTQSNSAAEDLKKVFDGFWALVSLHLHNQPKLVEVLRHVRTSLDGKAVTMGFRESADELAAQMPAMCKLISEHVKSHF